MDKKNKALITINDALAQIEIEIVAYERGQSKILTREDKDDYRIFGNQLSYIKGVLMKMKDQIDINDVPTKGRRLSFGRVIVDSWPMAKGPGSLREALLKADIAFGDI